MTLMDEFVLDYEIFDLGDVTLQGGATLRDAKLAYKTFGDPKLPAIVYPSWYSGRMHLSLSGPPPTGYKLTNTSDIR